MNPKKKSKELKRISRENLNGRYRLSMSVFLTVTLINLCIDRERSEDTLPNLLRNVNRSASARLFPRFCYKLSTG